MDPEHNPYSPPRANVEASDSPLGIEPVGKGKRFATYLIDYVILNLLLVIFGFIVLWAFGEAGARLVAVINDIVLGERFYLLYYIAFEGLFARTPAKFILGTVVVRDDGGRPTFGKIVIRTLCRFIPFEPFSFLGERGWHDGISDTRVISTRG